MKIFETWNKMNSTTAIHVNFAEIQGDIIKSKTI